MFDKAFKRINTFKDFRIELVEGKEKRAKTELEQEITKKQKVEDDKEKAELKLLMETILDVEEEAIDAIPLAVKLDEEVARKLQAEFDEEERLARDRSKKEQETNIALIKTWDDIQAKIDVDHQLAKRLQA
uniref:Uncharacterized protein n=1 Tax=Tanacetum cinerariifolium TaxID=118510 RepID=A0A699RYZ9_TANCI|nr:hypothetical protein [Tanacetum cinerariifolium]